MSQSIGVERRYWHLQSAGGVTYHDDGQGSHALREFIKRLNYEQTGRCDPVRWPYPEKNKGGFAMPKRELWPPEVPPGD